jgi:hypothetical protein
MNPKSEMASPLLRTILIFALIATCGALRLAPHPWNFTPIGAMAIFAGATIRNRSGAFLFPLLAMFATDLIIGFNILSPLVYTSFAVSVLIGRSLCGAEAIVGGRLSGVCLGERSERATNPTNPKPSTWPGMVTRIASATFLGSLQFFLVTNFGVWAFLGSYPRTVAGLGACYFAGLPLFLNTLAGDFTYTALLFGAFALAHAALSPRVTASV